MNSCINILKELVSFAPGVKKIKVTLYIGLFFIFLLPSPIIFFKLFLHVSRNINHYFQKKFWAIGRGRRMEGN